MNGGEYSPLFETRRGKGRLIYRLFAISLFVAICFIWVYRFSYIISNEDRILVWLGLFGAEIWFGFYWILTQAFRWNLIFRQPFKNRLSQRSFIDIYLFLLFRILNIFSDILV